MSNKNYRGKNNGFLDPNVIYQNIDLFSKYFYKNICCLRIVSFCKCGHFEIISFLKVIMIH